MSEGKAVDSNAGVTINSGPYSVYSAGGLFTQDELAMNVMIKEAVWRLSAGKFQLVLPQTRELTDLDRHDVEAHLRNIDLLELMGSDIILARFDGAELESGTVVEFVIGKSLGKPMVILRCDFRRLSAASLTEPYNLMVKNWPRTVEVHLDSYVLWAGLCGEERHAPGDSSEFHVRMKSELSTIQKSVDEIAKQVIAGFEKVLKMESPIPAEYREVVYQAMRFSPGSGFDRLLTESELEEIFHRLRRNSSL
jgi:nucleoside 2-deoxyribosyltransferase